MINYTFIIPHKNCPDLLQRCVDSIPEREDIQIVVVDDNSDEGKKPVVPKRKGIEIVLLDAEHSKGAGHARNVGLGKAKGKWLLFPDSDDYYKDGYIDILDNYAKKDVDVVYFNFEYRDGKTEEELTPLRFRKDFDEYDGSDVAKECVKFHHNVPWTKMVRKDYLVVSNIKYEEATNGNDIYFSMKVGYNTDRIIVEKRPLYVYLRNPNSLVTRRPTAESAFCKLRHRIELNTFYDFINHPEWKCSASTMFFHFFKQTGLGFALLTLRYIYHFYNRRKAIIQYVNGK